MEWENIFDAVKESICVTDRENRVVRANKAATALFERDMDQMLGRHCWQIVHGTIEPIADCPILRMRQSMQRERLAFKRGERWFEEVADPIIDSENHLNGTVHFFFDITEKKLTEDRFKKSEEIFKDIFEASNVGKSITFISGEIEANKAFSNLLGYSKEDFSKKTWQELTHPDDVESNQAIISSILDGNEDSARFNKRYLHKDGAIVWADVSTVIRRDKDDNPLYFITTIIDISEQKRAEKLLRLSEKRFYKAFHSSPAGLTINRIADGKFVDANESFLKIFEFTHDEVVGLTSTELGIWTPEERKRIIQLQLESGGLKDFELQARSKSGRDIDILFSSKSVDLEGEPHHITTMIDITARKRAENKLVESEGKYRALFENMNAGFVLFEIIQDEEGTPIDLIIVAANKGFEITTGLKLQEATGKRLTHVLPGIENDEADWIGTYGKIALNGKSQQFEQGSELLGYYYSIIAYQAGPKQCAVTFIDISDQKKAEAEQERLHDQLNQAQKMESIGRLAGGVAHDFNNMLSIIIGYGENLLGQLRQGDPMRDDVKEIVKAGHRSAGLTRQLLAFSRKQTLQPEVLNLNKILLDLEKMLKRMIGEDIQLELALAPDIEQVLVDPGQIEQVIMNLAVNARDAMPAGGKLLIETTQVELDEAYAEKHVEVIPGMHVLLAMTDTGCGMDQAVLSNIFEPFYTTKGKDKGTGLGLSTVYGIVKQSKGHIWVYSEPNQGTSFKIYFPQVLEKQTSPKREKVVIGKEAGNKHILAVEDEESLRKYIEVVLSRLGFKATVVANGGEALLMIEEKGLKPDLILTDVIMPNMSGRELVNRLSKNRPELKVLYMSGYTDNAIVHHGVLEPGVHFIQKPFTINQLFEKINEVLSSDV